VRGRDRSTRPCFSPSSKAPCPRRCSGDNPRSTGARAGPPIGTQQRVGKTGTTRRRKRSNARRSQSKAATTHVGTRRERHRLADSSSRPWCRSWVSSATHMITPRRYRCTATPRICHQRSRLAAKAVDYDDDTRSSSAAPSSVRPAAQPTDGSQDSGSSPGTSASRERATRRVTSSALPRRLLSWCIRP